MVAARADHRRIVEVVEYVLLDTLARSPQCVGNELIGINPQR